MYSTMSYYNENVILGCAAIVIAMFTLTQINGAY